MAVMNIISLKFQFLIKGKKQLTNLIDKKNFRCLLFLKVSIILNNGQSPQKRSHIFFLNPTSIEYS